VKAMQMKPNFVSAGAREWWSNFSLLVTKVLEISTPAATNFRLHSFLRSQHNLGAFAQIAQVFQISELPHLYQASFNPFYQQHIAGVF
jgi:hypothetical protein